jgi:flagellar biosynthetic protein FlhB
MAEDSDLERTEPASARKLEQARERGQVPRSSELATLAVMLASVGILFALSVFMYEGLSNLLRNALDFGRADVLDVSMMGRNLLEFSMSGLIVYLPMALAVVVAAVGANIMLSGWVMSAEALEPNFSKMNPLSGIARMFSRTALAELVKALLKGGLIAGVAGWMIWQQHDGILGLMNEPLDAAVIHFGQIALMTLIASIAAFSLVVIIDVPYQIWDYHHGLRMTKEELRQESRELEGDPQLKARIRALQRESARRRMMQSIPQADVVVTNPLHFAVALKYDEKAMAAPVVLAKGSQLVAERIKELAREHRIPVVEAPPLARALHRHVEIGSPIPDKLFTAVAQVLAYVYQVNKSMAPTLPNDWQVPSDLDPGVPVEAI